MKGKTMGKDIKTGEEVMVIVDDKDVIGHLELRSPEGMGGLEVGHLGEKLVFVIDPSASMGASNSGKNINVCSSGGQRKTNEFPNLTFTLNAYRPAETDEEREECKRNAEAHAAKDTSGKGKGVASI